MHMQQQRVERNGQRLTIVMYKLKTNFYFKQNNFVDHLNGGYPYMDNLHLYGQVPSTSVQPRQVLHEVPNRVACNVPYMQLITSYHISSQYASPTNHDQPSTTFKCKSGT